MRSDIEALGRELYDLIKTNPGKLMVEIAQALGKSRRDLLLPTRKLLDQKLIKMKKINGNRRTTKYYAV